MGTAFKTFAAALLLAALCSCGWFGRETGRGGTAGAVTEVSPEVVADAAEVPVTEQEQEEEDLGDAFRRRQTDIAEIGGLMQEYPSLEGWSPYNAPFEPFFITGNFFGDREDDTAILVQNEYTDRITLCVINRGGYGPVFVEFDEENAGGDDYYWVDVFEKVDRGEILFSNYEDDFRSLEDVPENERVVLDYDAIFVHVREACGGGFIFWLDGQWNWLQQE